MKKLLLLFVLSLSFASHAQLNGTYIIGTGQTYPTLATAVAALNLSGISGNVTLLIDQNQTAVTPYILNQYTGSGTYTTTIKPNASKTVSISGSIADGAVFQLNGADNIIIDGNNGTADKQLTIYNTFNISDSYTNRMGIWLYNTANNNKFRNLVVQLNMLNASIGTFSTGVLSGSNSVGGAANNSNNEVNNVTFTNVKQAVYVNGSNASNTNWTISNNTIGSASDAGKPLTGIYLNNVSTYTISGNTIDGLKKPGTNGTHTYSGAAIYVEGSGSANGSILSNTIKNIDNASGSGICFGINIVGASASTGINTTISANSVSSMSSSSTNDNSFNAIGVTGKGVTIYNNKITSISTAQAKLATGIYINGDTALLYNNMVANVNSSGGGGTDSQNGFGIYINAGADVKLYFNTVRLETNQSSGASACLYIKAGSQLDIRNNIFVNAQTSGSVRFAVYSAVTSTGSFTNIDYNDYSSAQHIGCWGDYYTTSNRKATLADWKSATTKDANSINVLPVFTSGTDLHINASNAGNLSNLDGKGTPISGITTDIDIETRNVATPDVGADEFGPKCSGTSTTWNGSSWSTGAPTSLKPAIINGNYNTGTNGNITACELTVNATFVLTIASGGSVKVENGITTVGSGATQGSIVVQNSGNLIQVDDSAASAPGTNVTVVRTSTSLKQYDYTYWSSPVAGATLSTVSTPSIYYEFNPLLGTTGNWVSLTAETVMQPGGGYIARAPNNLVWANNPTVTATFKGTANSGKITKTIYKNGTTSISNLVGNPYPSALDAKEFLLANQANITGNLYFWTHYTKISNPTGNNNAQNYTTDDYAVYNLTGSTGTGTGNTSGGSEVQSNRPNGQIASGQAFFIEARNNNVSIQFTNAMRTGGANTQFFRAAAPTTNSGPSEKSRVWVNLTNEEGAYAETLVGYVDNATNDLDNLFDAVKLDGGNYVSLYSILGPDNLVIQGRALPFSDSDIVPLGYNTTISGTFKISLDDFDGLFTNQDVYLLDKLTDTSTNLTNGSYSFSTEAGTFNNRFELRYTNATLGIENPAANPNAVVVFRKGNHIEVKSDIEEIQSIVIYDLLGRTIYSNDKIHTAEFATNELNFCNQVVIVKVKMANNTELTKKVILN